MPAPQPRPASPLAADPESDAMIGEEAPSRPLSPLQLYADAADSGSDQDSNLRSIHASDIEREVGTQSSSSDADAEWTFHQRDYLRDHASSDSDTASSSDSDASDSEDIVENISEDPFFATRGSLFNDDKDVDIDPDLEERDLPPAFYDHPAVRNAYIRVFVGCAFENMTHSAARLMLDGSALMLDLAHRTTEQDIPGLESFARTLATVERRLGVSTEGFITYLFVCDVCWHVHRPEELPSLPDSGRCTDEDCQGKLFTSKRMSNGKLKRTPVKIMPFVDPERAIAHMLMRPGKYAQLQHWRLAGDAPGPAQPLELQGYDAFEDPDKPMKTISDGWAWRAIRAGLVRRRTGNWKIEDVDVRGLDQRFVALPCGLVWQMNIDWYVSTTPYAFNI